MSSKEIKINRDTTDVDVQEASKTKYQLPPRYVDGLSSFMERAQALDPDYRHRWVHISPRNQTVKAWSGWTPLTDRDKIRRLGLESMITANGRVRWMDTELWVMPVGLADVIRKKMQADVAARSSSVQAILEAEARETEGRSKGQAVPFIQSGPVGDVLEKVPMKIESIQGPRPTNTKPKE